MPNFTVTITGQKKIEAIRQARKAYDDAQQTSATVQNPYTPLADNQAYIQLIVDSAVNSWKQQYKDKIAAALAPTEAAAAAAAAAAFADAVNAIDPTP